jgi:hypothetical protein
MFLVPRTVANGDKYIVGMAISWLTTLYMSVASVHICLCFRVVHFISCINDVTLSNFSRLNGLFFTNRAALHWTFLSVSFGCFGLGSILVLHIPVFVLLNSGTLFLNLPCTMQEIALQESQYTGSFPTDVTCINMYVVL